MNKTEKEAAKLSADVRRFYQAVRLVAVRLTIVDGQALYPGSLCSEKETNQDFAGCFEN